MIDNVLRDPDALLVSEYNRGWRDGRALGLIEANSALWGGDKLPLIYEGNYFALIGMVELNHDQIKDALLKGAQYHVSGVVNATTNELVTLNIHAAPLKMRKVTDLNEKANWEDIDGNG